MRTTEGDKIYAIVRTHIGAGDAISAPAIAKHLGWRAYRERVVRLLISDESHLWPNILVCSIPGRGFFCAETYEEAEAYDNWLGDLITSAREKQIIFRVACQKMGFHFTRTNERKAA